MWVFEPDNVTRRTSLDSAHQTLYVNASIHIRGQYSASFRKKQFSLSAINPDGSEMSINLLGMPKGEGMYLCS